MECEWNITKWIHHSIQLINVCYQKRSSIYTAITKQSDVKLKKRKEKEKYTKMHENRINPSDCNLLETFKSILIREHSYTIFIFVHVNSFHIKYPKQYCLSVHVNASSWLSE